MKNQAVIDRLEAAMAALAPLDTRAMIGGLCFMLRGNMVCGAMRDGALFRVGSEGLAEALALDGVQQMEMGGRRMSGYVHFPAPLLQTGPEFDTLLGLALAENARLKAK